MRLSTIPPNNPPARLDAQPRPRYPAPTNGAPVQPIPLMVELCAGTAALSLRLHRDGARPPVSRMGSKSGYSDALLRVLGLTPGQRAAAYLWCEPDPGVRLLLHAYRDAGLARAAAAIIRSWAAEDPRALWERLRAEGPPRVPEGAVEAGEVARWAWVVRRSWKGHDENGYMGPDPVNPVADPVRQGSRWTPEQPAPLMELLPSLPATIAPDARLIDPREVARYAQIVASNRLIHTAWSDAEGRWINTGDGGATFGGPAFASPPERTAEGLDAAPADLPAVVAPDAREVDPREVARWVFGSAASYSPRFPFDGFLHPEEGGRYGAGRLDVARKIDALPRLPATIAPDAREVNPREVARWVFVQSSNTMIALDSNWRNTGVGGSTFHGGERAGDPFRAAVPLERTCTMPALIHPDARTIDPPTLPPGTVVFCDPPYQNTTPYAHDLPRAEVVALARRWAAAGATVAVSEAEPIPELVAEGWYSVDITNQRAGQKRTFSKQQAEHVTLNRPPAWVPPVQGRLF